jgi:hypothetical protein
VVAGGAAVVSADEVSGAAVVGVVVAGALVPGSVVPGAVVPGAVVVGATVVGEVAVGDVVPGSGKVDVVSGGFDVVGAGVDVVDAVDAGSDVEVVVPLSCRFAIWTIFTAMVSSTRWRASTADTSDSHTPCLNLSGKYLWRSS